MNRTITKSSHASALRNQSEALLAQCTVLITIVILVVDSGGASAYSLDIGGFADGTDSVDLMFNASERDAQGPSIRLLTNSTIISGSVDISGREGLVNRSFTETTSADFLSGSMGDGILVSGGSITLDSASSLVVLNETNSFGNSTLNGTSISNGSVVLSGGSQGDFTSGNIPAPRSGWGNLLAAVDASGGGSVSISILSSNLTLLVSNQSIGGVVNLDPVVFPVIRLRGTLNAPSGAESPQVRWITIGQQAGDNLYGDGVTRALTSVVPNGNQYTISRSFTSFSESSSSPYVHRENATYYSAKIEDANVLTVGSTWHLFAAVSNGSWLRIGHATSSDFSNWTWDANPVLENGSSGWDDLEVFRPWVISAPSGGFLMYYSGRNSTTNQVGVGISNSDDLSNWSKYSANPILTNSSTGWDSGDAGNAVVSYQNGTWKMWYAGNVSSSGSSLGYATSSDGYNWSKYSGNPILSRGGAGSFDQADLLLKTIRNWNGVYHAYYACHNSAKYRVCHANSTDGVNWTKYSGFAYNTPSAAWENAHVLPGDVVVSNGSIVLLYSGCNSGCANVEVGRADANYANGTIRGTLDFATRIPIRFGPIAINSTAPNGASVQVGTRTSADAISWSAYETLVDGATPQTIVSNRFLQWFVYLNASSTGEPPLFGGLTISYFAYVTSGRYESSLFSFADNVSGVILTVSPALQNGSVALEVSADNGKNWTRVTQGSFTPLNGSDRNLSYGLSLEGGTNKAPIVDDVFLVVQQSGLPSNVTVRIGLNGTPIVNFSGTFDRSVNTSLPVDELNQLITQTKATNPNITALDIPFYVSSDHFGVVRIANVRVTLSLGNPLNVVFSPAPTFVRIPENSSIQFYANASTYPPDTPINITWYFDGVEQTIARYSPNFTYSPDHFAAGIHSIRALVENGDYFINRSWTVNVTNVNRPPRIDSALPAGAVNASHAATFSFVVSVSDEDLDALALVWKLDGTQVASNVTSAELTQLSLGPHFVMVEVSDGLATVRQTWNLTTTNVAPEILNRTPDANVSISHAEIIRLSVLAYDEDAEPLAYLWQLDGTNLSANGSAVNLSDLSLGFHALRLRVRDRFVQVEVSWALLVTNAPPEIVLASPAGNFSLSHTARAVFQVQTMDPDGDLLNVTWRVNGNPVAWDTDTLELQQAAPGPILVRVDAVDSFASASYEWLVNFTNTPPEIRFTAPADATSLSHATTALFQIQTNDADGDPLNVTWRVDGSPVAWDARAFALQAPAPGLLLIRVDVSDPFSTAYYEWRVNVTNAVPTIVYVLPGDIVVSSLANTTRFEVIAGDADLDPLSFSWALDQTPLGSNSTTVEVGPLAPGSHTLSLAVSDGMAVAYWLGTITSVNLPPVLLRVSPPLAVTLSHLAAAMFSVETMDHESETLLYAWMLDGELLPGARNWTTLGSLQPGDHLLAVIVTDGHSNVSAAWSVKSEDYPPIVRAIVPSPGNLTVEASLPLNLSVDVFDPEGDNVTIQWMADGSVFSTAPNTQIIWSSVGARVVTLSVNSLAYQFNFTWAVRVISENRPPVLTQIYPNQSAVIVFLDSDAPFFVLAEDDGILPVQIRWELDGRPVSNSSAIVLRFSGGEEGDHSLTLKVFDGVHTLEQSWALKVKPRSAAETQATDLSNILVPTIFFVAFVGAAAAVMRRSRRRKGGDEQ